MVGLPKKMNNEEGERCVKTREFAQKLQERTGLEVIFWDERLTTVEAGHVLDEAGVQKNRRKEYIDKLAASIILENYLESISE